MDIALRNCYEIVYKKQTNIKKKHIDDLFHPTRHLAWLWYNYEQWNFSDEFQKQKIFVITKEMYE